MNLFEEEPAIDPALVPDPDALARRIVADIDAWEADLSGLRRRWDRNAEIYRVNPDYVTMQAVDGMEPYPVPLSRIKCDNVVGNVRTALFAAEPYVNVESGGDANLDAQRERAITKLAKEARMERMAEGTLWCAYQYNLGILRLAAVSDNGIKGIEGEWLDPRHVCVYPSDESDPWRSRTFGHRFYEPMWTVERRMEEGIYASERLFGTGDRRSHEPNPSASPLGEATTARRADDSPELWEVETWERTPLGWKRLLCTLARNPAKLLRAREYRYEVSRYSIWRFLNTEKGLLTEDSLAQALQGVNIAASDLFTAYVQVALGKATPMVFVIGGSLGPDRVQQFSWGTIYDGLDEGTQIVPISPGGDVSGLAASLEKIEQYADGVAGVSQIGSSQPLPASTSATAVNALMQGDSRGQDRLLQAATEGAEQAFRILDAIWRADYEGFVRLYGRSVRVDDPQKLTSATDITSSARTVGSPQVLMQKLQALWEMSQDPASALDRPKVAQRIIQALNLPFEPEDVAGQLQTGVSMEQLAALGGGGLPSAPAGPAAPDPAAPGQPVG
ncbi:MAG: hypothetical protein EOO66_06560 [Methylobacterium sp.]|nr:MAG: hypothetical protein EOO66_06560 [Methylobacterium sp.]